MDETIIFLDVTSFVPKLINAYICTHFLQTHVFNAIFAFLTTFSLVETVCVQMMTLKLKKLLPVVKHFVIQKGASK